MENYKLDLDKYAKIARQASAEGCVLLENKNNALPIRAKEHVAVFGRCAYRYYKSGLGSGGLVNARYTVGILDALQKEDIVLDADLDAVYRAWLAENPYDEGEGWGKVPWSQKEMPVTQEMLDIAAKSDVALVVIGRTAGEDQDNNPNEGSFCLSKTEEELIAGVTAAAKRTVVVLNVGNVIDMSWVKKYGPQAVLYVWQGGQEGGLGAADVLVGRVNACGKLADTVAVDQKAIPSDENFGDLQLNYYKEDVYVGYRYFETFAPEKVLYPFGFGLSYTTFATSAVAEDAGDALRVAATVANTGDVAGKEVVQVYVKAPTGLLGNPARKLIGFAKTKELAPGEQETLELVIPKYTYAVYDDGGKTGHKSCYVLEAGSYGIYVGSDVRSAACVGTVEQPFTVVEQLTEAYAPVKPFARMKAVCGEDGVYAMETEDVPTRTVDLNARMAAAPKEEIPYTGDRGYRLVDVLDGRVSMDDFVAQLSDEDLIHIFRGEGMCSVRVTPGTAAAFGGVTDRLQQFGIPAACCADGPSGIRMDCGTKAFSLPNGTLLACTFNEELNEELYGMLGRELRLNKVDTLLGPGMNVHRHPLNGRNFEYFSEDPLLAGKMAAAQLRGMNAWGVTGTIKHFCCNNQESGRRTSDSVLSERALREIYLKVFEIAVKEGGARSVMTSYGSVNGLWTAGSFDLCTTILRGEWGFDGIVMTDWWAESNYEGELSKQTVKAPMVRAQNDLYMCVLNSVDNPENDDVAAKLAEGVITRGELQRNAKNILGFILKSPSILHLEGHISAEELEVMNSRGDNDFSAADLVYYAADENGCVVIPGSKLDPRLGNSDVFGVVFKPMQEYTVSMKLSTDLGRLAQLPVSVFFDNALKTTITIHGTDGCTVEESRDLGFIFGSNHFIKLYYGASGLNVEEVTFCPKKGEPAAK